MLWNVSSSTGVSTLVAFSLSAELAAVPIGTYLPLMKELSSFVGPKQRLERSYPGPHFVRAENRSRTIAITANDGRGNPNRCVASPDFQSAAKALLTAANSSGVHLALIPDQIGSERSSRNKREVGATLEQI
jgi:hypothetical protein